MPVYRNIPRQTISQIIEKVAYNQLSNYVFETPVRL